MIIYSTAAFPRNGEKGFFDALRKSEDVISASEKLDRISQFTRLLSCPVVENADKHHLIMESARTIIPKMKNRVRRKILIAWRHRQSCCGFFLTQQTLWNGNDSVKYIEGIARLCAYLRIGVGEDELQFKTRNNDDALARKSRV